MAESNALLLDVRKGKRRKKPTFLRQESHKKKRLKKCWRRPDGSGSKMRLKIRGYSRCISVGYKSPAAVRGLSPNGLGEIIVSSIKDLKGINADTEGIIIKKNVGIKKKVEIAKAALAGKIKILNLKDPQGFVNMIEDEIKKKKTKKKEASKEKEKKKADLKKKSEEKEKKKKAKDKEKTLDSITDEDIQKKKDKEKKEKDKLLIKKDS